MDMAAVGSSSVSAVSAGSFVFAQSSIGSNAVNNHVAARSTDSPAYIVSLAEPWNSSSDSKSVAYPRPANQLPSSPVNLVNWHAIMVEPSFLWNFVNNPHALLKQGLNVDSTTAKKIIADAIIHYI
ncbi:hypothetical protein [Sporomusa malonica]|uniref:Uncharacterized protein n=1 Tax=Sporomusa malonica TaxID=112901 RepID=A0A1W2EWL4_9FIRM|nr:hypothetical protein [Sporomusa malonica]SMD13942.1 hypothetical protein SAMN04488500_13230 [Sporomusa malonica]